MKNGFKSSFDQKFKRKTESKNNLKSRNAFKSILRYEEVNSLRRTLNEKYYNINRHTIYFRENNIYQDSNQILEYLKKLPKPVFLTDKNYSNKDEKKSRILDINVKKEKRLYSEKNRKKLESRNRNIPHELFDYIHPYEYYSTPRPKIISTDTPLKSSKKSKKKLILSTKYTEPIKRVEKLNLKDSSLFITSSSLKKNSSPKKILNLNDDENIKHSQNIKTIETINNSNKNKSRRRSQITYSNISKNFYSQKMLAFRDSRKSNTNKTTTYQNTSRNNFNFFIDSYPVNENGSIINTNNNKSNSELTKSNIFSKKKTNRILSSAHNKSRNYIKIKSKLFIDQISNIKKESRKLQSGIKNAFSGTYYNIKASNIKKALQGPKKEVSVVKDILNKDEDDENEEINKNLKLCKLMNQNKITELLDNAFKYNTKSYDGFLGREFLMGLKRFQTLQAKEQFIKGNINEENVKKDKHKKTEKQIADESRKNLSNNIKVMKSLWYKVNDRYKK